MFALLLPLSALAAAQAAASPAVMPPAAASDPAGAPGEKTQPAPHEQTRLKIIPYDPRRLPRPAVLKNPGEIASHQDYPKEALQKEMQGTTRVRLQVDTEGRVTSCAIAQSSGHELLDVQTCDLLTAHALFEPGRDRRGKAVPSEVCQHIAWRLESGTVIPRNFITRTTTIVGPQGELRSCKVEIFFEKEWRETPAEFCDEVRKTSADHWLALRERSKVHDAVLVAETRVLTDSAESMPDVGGGKGEVLIALRSARMSFAQDGKRTSCTMLGHVGMQGYRDDLCKNADDWAAAPPPELLAKGELANVRFLTAVYLSGEPD